MFTDKEKIELANGVIEHYFNQNFGTMAKSDLEVYLFSRYFDHLKSTGNPYDDYTLSRELGITQSRIRSLKERMELKYPYARSQWKEIFASELKKAKYDKNDHHVKFIVQDINVLNEVRHYVEINGWYDEYSLNRKLLNLPLSCFVDICCEDEEIKKLLSSDTKKNIRKIAKQDSSIVEFVDTFTKDGLKRFLMSAGKEALDLVLQNIPFSGTAKTVFEILGNVIKNT